MKIQTLNNLNRLSGLIQRKTSNHCSFARYLSNVANVDSHVNQNKQTDNQIDPIMLNRNFLINEPNPVNHLPKHIGMFYTIPEEINNTIFAVYGWSERQRLIFKTFAESSIIIRKFAMDIMEKIRKNEVLNDKFERFIFHGLTGSGKTTTLNHLIHFANKSNFVVFHLNEILNLTRLPFDHRPSEYKKKEGRVDTPMNGTMLLQHFKAQNANLIKDLKLSKTYEWSLKELSEKGEPLINVVNHGINRSDHSCDCYAVLVRELKLAAEQGLVKLVVAIDNINFLYWPTDLRRPDWSYYTTLDITITRAFRKLISDGFKNGILLATTDKRNHPRWDPAEQNLSDDPFELLLTDGVKELKDFQTIEIGHYDDFEFLNCLAYYNHKNFLTHPKILTTKGIEQLRFITTKLPQDLFEQVKWL